MKKFKDVTDKDKLYVYDTKKNIFYVLNVVIYTVSDRYIMKDIYIREIDSNKDNDGFIVVNKNESIARYKRLIIAMNPSELIAESTNKKHTKYKINSIHFTIPFIPPVDTKELIERYLDLPKFKLKFNESNQITDIVFKRKCKFYDKKILLGNIADELITDINNIELWQN